MTILLLLLLLLYVSNVHTQDEKRHQQQQSGNSRLAQVPLAVEHTTQKAVKLYNIYAMYEKIK